MNNAYKVPGWSDLVIKVLPAMDGEGGLSSTKSYLSQLGHRSGPVTLDGGNVQVSIQGLRSQCLKLALRFSSVQCSRCIENY